MKFPAWLTAQVLSLAAIGVCAYGWIGSCNAADTAEARANKAAEAAKIAKEKLQKAEEVSVADLKRERNLSQMRLAEALKAAGIKAEPVFVASGTTGPVVAGGETQAGTSSPAPSAPRETPVAGSSPLAAGCLLREGEKGEIRVSAAGAETKAGNVVVDGQADAYSGERHLFGGPLRLDVKLSPQAPEPRAAGWGIGAATVLTRSGWSVGPAVAAPTLSLWKLHLDASAGVTLGPQGEWAGTGTVIFRWR